MKTKNLILIIGGVSVIVSISGCMATTDNQGRFALVSAFDQSAIKAELQKADREYGNR